MEEIQDDISTQQESIEPTEIKKVRKKRIVKKKVVNSEELNKDVCNHLLEKNNQKSFFKKFYASFISKLDIVFNPIIFLVKNFKTLFTAFTSILIPYIPIVYMQEYMPYIANQIMPKEYVIYKFVGMISCYCISFIVWVFCVVLGNILYTSLFKEINST